MGTQEPRTKRIYKQQTTQVIDPNTGELVEYENTQGAVLPAEPNYIKLYYETMLTYNGIDGIPVNFMLVISKYLTYAGPKEPMTIALNQMVKQQLVEVCGVKMAQVYRYIKTAKEKGLLLSTDFRGVYEVNPIFIAKGRWQDICELQTTLMFDKGTWTRTIKKKATPSADEELRLTSPPDQRDQPPQEAPQSDEQPQATQTTPAQFVAQGATQEAVSEPLPGQEAFWG